jgi:nitrogen fixation protein NifU and related proteins
MYSARLLDHFQHPRNAGEIADADVTAHAENPVCGDVLRLTAKTSAGKISSMRFKAKGCVASIACASALTELVEGKSIDVAAKLGKEDIVTAVGGLPEASNHAAQLALDALSSVLHRIHH